METREATCWCSSCQAHFCQREIIFGNIDLHEQPIQLTQKEYHTINERQLTLEFFLVILTFTFFILLLWYVPDIHRFPTMHMVKTHFLLENL